ncbi:nucleotidyltransferase family protein [Qipengyuania spongiae]|uniref:Nucleotidyltransferase family protein n=1 Tax=Qipengyuania spongiae TaxID=2909673 RepID=A0ABY5T179_9SPHN|nr:nucleotidyltransferase family protein [Qipengyuania spongiae]UVI39093.1 nucleotidyltransferase family protein [Qipengyuania spongiae]
MDDSGRSDALSELDPSRYAHIDSLLALLGLWFVGEEPSPKVEDWNTILDIAARTKTAGLVAHVADRVAVPEGIAGKISQMRDAILVRNLRNLDWTTKAVMALDAAGITSLVFKGVLRSKQVYGTWNVRASNDIDLLVPRSRYDEARKALKEAGFAPQVPDDSQWWHRCLGEAPYRRGDSDCPFIDLHQSLQQPGGPYPLDLESFFDTAITTKFGGVDLRTPDPLHALLICAINYGKAVRAHDPVIAPLHELAYATREFGPDEEEQLRQLARKQGLRRLVDRSLADANTMFPYALDQTDRDIHSDPVSLAMRPWRERPVLHRTRLIWEWTDGRLPGRVGGFGSGIGRVLMSNLQHHIDERRGRLALGHTA